ncbi:MAG TPA: NUDIX hydrolase [Aestuariivirga sp.]|jgi:8-oxo-dGTP pyrophosphatase MutT (NUDIX family)|nr:NUDIX hydrolase [Hyphomicrobiales bacterium]MBP9174921.1 NUDIX hydrolase [Hyphomicrobiales bacterium]HQY74791.1 NUDIX hydrolase [Aestuariivirga sp.]HRA93259.1 NUDIX hydrolase [Aestuariivirga sp.]
MHQIAALPFYDNPGGGVDVCLVTARGSGRWIIPKGNPIRGLAPHEVAAREAFEEAGLVGHVGKCCIGTFKFERSRNGRDATCRVDVYALRVERQMQTWTEMHERSVLRCNVKTALSLVSVPNLATLINRYAMAHV